MIGPILSARTAALVSAGAMLVALAACGGAAESGMPGAKSPDAEPNTAAEPMSIEEAQQRIAAAKAELARGGGAGADAPAGQRYPPPPPPPPPAADASRPSEPSTSPVKPSASPSKSTTPAKPSVSESATPATEDRCGRPCRALASMRRAVTALCRMTGNEDARCVDAKHTLADSEGRVSPCSC